MTDLWPWVMLALLGAYHGINPGMGWLFAVSLGLQERSRKAVIRAFAPIAFGHFASIAIVVGLVAALRFTVSPLALRYTGAAALVAFGIYKLTAPMSHPRWVGMRVGARQLALWSFLMATAHGAGLMVVPVILKIDARPAAASVVDAAPVVKLHPVSMEEGKKPAPAAVSPVKAPKPTTESTTEAVPSCHAQIGQMAESTGNSMIVPLAGAALHTLVMFGVMAIIALIVYDRVGLRILRTAWVNLDMIWAAALIGAGLLTAVL